MSIPKIRAVVEKEIVVIIGSSEWTVFDLLPEARHLLRRYRRPQRCIEWLQTRHHRVVFLIKPQFDPVGERLKRKGAQENELKQECRNA